MLAEFTAIKTFLMFTGIALTATETLCIYIKNKGHKQDKIATSEIGDKNELDELKGTKGIRISKNIKLSCKTSMEHIAVIGATGSGKSTSIFIPALLNDELEGSLVILDAKGELHSKTGYYQEHTLKRKVMSFSPLHPEISIKYNPLEQTKSIGDVIQLAQIILINGTRSLEMETGVKSGGIEFLNMAVPLFASSLLYVKSKGKPLNTISNATRLLLNNSMEDLELLFKSNEEAAEQFKIFNSSKESPKTMSSIKITLLSNLQIFLDKDIERITSSTEVTPEDLRNKRIALYIEYPETKSNYLAPLLAVFYTQLINNLMQLSGNNIYMIFDEFASCGVIGGFSKIIAVARSKKISFIICLQSISQLNQLYGNENSKSILNNLETKIILPSMSDPETLKYISSLTGETEIQTKSTTENGKNISHSYSSTKKVLFTPDEIRRIKKDEVLILSHNLLPVIDKQNIYYLNAEYSDKVKQLHDL